MPQGTVLGPILFILYINSIFNIPTSGQVFSYADDTAVLYKDNSWNSLRNKVEKDLILFKNWFDRKLLTINIKKTMYLPFALYINGLPNYNTLKIGGTQSIQMTNSIKYLGVTLDPHLRWNEHIKSVTHKLRCILFRFKQLKKYLSTFQLRSVYTALVESHLSYGIIAWGGALNRHMLILEIMQKKFLKILLGKSQLFSSNRLFEESKIPDLKQLFFIKSVSETYLENNIQLISVQETRQTSLRSKYVPKMNTTTGQRSWSFLGPRCFNKLPDHIKSLPRNKFKIELKKYVMVNRLKINTQIDLKNQTLI